MSNREFIFGVDLDGVVADFYGSLRSIAAEWLGVSASDLPEKVSYGLPEWRFGAGGSWDYEYLHRFAVTQKHIFRTVKPIDGAASALRCLAYTHKIRVRIITHRLYTAYTHQVVVQDTTQWLDEYGIPYWDLCFMREKGEVNADLYIDDTPHNIEALRKANKDVIIFSNSTNRNVDGERAESWDEVQKMVVARLVNWKTNICRPLPTDR